MKYAITFEYEACPATRVIVVSDAKTTDEAVKLALEIVKSDARPAPTISVAEMTLKMEVPQQ